MALRVGNLLVDLNMNSFISLAEAREYLSEEAGLPLVDAWLGGTESEQEASLVRASRWLSTFFVWCVRHLDDDQLKRVGFAAARMATEALTVNLYEAIKADETIQTAKAGEVSVTYATGAWSQMQAAGRLWPWLTPYLDGLICEPGLGIVAMLI